jgi:adenosylhomocysteine nucleosidase
MSMMATGRTSEPEPLTGIVAAMEEEVVDLRARMTGARSVPVTGARITVGWIGGERVALAVTGDGERNASRGLRALLGAQPVKRIVVVGVAGGLSPDLDVGALVVADRVINQADGGVRAADPTLVAAATAYGARRAVAVTAIRIADTVADKRSLLAMAGAVAGQTAAIGERTAPPTAVVDMESAEFAAVASRAGVPWMVVRAVSDTAVDSIPPLLNRSRDDGGAVRRGRVVWGLLSEPRTLLPLLALRERVRTCARHLAQAVEQMVVALHAADNFSRHVVASTEGKETDIDGA